MKKLVFAVFLFASALSAQVQLGKNVQIGGTGSTAFTLTTTGTSGASTYTGGILNIPQYAGGGVTSINGTPGAFTFGGSGVTCTLTTCTFTGAGGGTPAGANRSIQFNNAGAFGGSNITTDATFSDFLGIRNLATQTYTANKAYTSWGGAGSA